jgi:hypothetical protein
VRAWRWLAAMSLLSVGCATVTPMQTASVVEVGVLRVGGQVAFAGFCGDVPMGVLGLTRCTEYPDGVPFPEVRVNGRRGLLKRVDVGASLQLAPQLLASERAMQAGLTLDGKVELLHLERGPVTHIISLGLLGGSAIAGRFGLRPSAQVEGGVPVFYGLQLAGFEVVVGAAWSVRGFFFGNGVTEPALSQRLELRLGLFRRPTSWGLQLGYLTDPARFTAGAPQVQFSWLWDFAWTLGRSTRVPQPAESEPIQQAAPVEE